MSFHIIKHLIPNIKKRIPDLSWQQDSPQQAETDMNTQFTVQDMRSQKKQPEILRGNLFHTFLRPIIRQPSKKEKVTRIMYFHKPFKPEFGLKLQHIISLMPSQAISCLLSTYRTLQATLKSESQIFSVLSYQAY